MSKKRDTDLKYANRGSYEQRGTSQISKATVENREIPEETAQNSNPVTNDMVESRKQAIEKNKR